MGYSSSGSSGSGSSSRRDRGGMSRRVDRIGAGVSSNFCSLFSLQGYETFHRFTNIIPNNNLTKKIIS